MLINTEAVHDTYYKHLQYKLTRDSKDKMSLKVGLNYVVQAGYAQASVHRALKLTSSEIVDCVICKSSKILLAGKEGWQTVYELGNEVVNLHSLIEESVWENSIVEL